MAMGGMRERERENWLGWLWLGRLVGGLRRDAGFKGSEREREGGDFRGRESERKREGVCYGVYGKIYKFGLGVGVVEKREGERLG